MCASPGRRTPVNDPRPFFYALIGLIYGTEIFIEALVKKTAVAGWTSLMIIVLIMGGMQMVMMGMLGEYLWRTYDETRGRPKYVIEKNTLQNGKLHNDKNG